MSAARATVRSLVLFGLLSYSLTSQAGSESRAPGRFYFSASAGPGYGWRVVKRGTQLPTSHEGAAFGVARVELGMAMTSRFAVGLGVEGFYYEDAEIPTEDSNAVTLGDSHGEVTSFGVDYQHETGWAARFTTGIYEQTTSLKDGTSAFDDPAEVTRGLALGLSFGRRWELAKRWRIGVLLNVFGSPKLSGTFHTGGWFGDSYGVTGRFLNTNVELVIAYD